METGAFRGDARHEEATELTTWVVAVPQEILHLCSLQHALQLQCLRLDPNLDNLIPFNRLDGFAFDQGSKGLARRDAAGSAASLAARSAKAAMQNSHDAAAAAAGVAAPATAAAAAAKTLQAANARRQLPRDRHRRYSVSQDQLIGGIQQGLHIAGQAVERQAPLRAQRRGSADIILESPRVVLADVKAMRRGSLGGHAGVRAENFERNAEQARVDGARGPADVIVTVFPDNDPQEALPSQHGLPVVKLKVEQQPAAEAASSDDSSIDGFDSAEEDEPEYHPHPPQPEPEPEPSTDIESQTAPVYSTARRNSVMLDIESGFGLHLDLPPGAVSSEDEMGGETKPMVADVPEADDATFPDSDRTILLQKVWKKVDIDGSGTLDRDEVRSVLVQMGWENVTTARLDDVWEQLDEDHSGDVDFDEFSAWFLAQDQKSIENTMIDSGLTDQEMMQMMAAAATLEASSVLKDGKTPRGRASHKVDEKMYVDGSYVDQLKNQNDSYPLGVIGGLKGNERRALKNCETFNGARVQLAQSWVVRSITRRRKAGGLGVDAPVLATGIYRSFQNGNEAFQQCKKIVDTPFPLPYAQAVLIMLIAWMIFVPILICEIVNGATFASASSPALPQKRKEED